jgi:5-methylcytosine-specific restriction endonuclease McrA
MSARIFSEADDEVLKEFYASKTNKELVELFNGQFSANQIKYRANALGLRKTKETKTRARVAKGWELWEIEVVRRHYHQEGTKGCQEYLPHRSLNAIRYKAKRMGLILSEESKRKSFANGPKQHSEKTKAKISRAHKGRPKTKRTRKRISKALSGRNNPNYIDGRSYKQQKYSSGWERIREEIKDRDSHHCQICGKKNLLVVHHIDWDKKNSVSENLITLCRKHHAKVHKNKEKYLQTLLDLAGSHDQNVPNV